MLQWPPDNYNKAALIAHMVALQRKRSHFVCTHQPNWHRFRPRNYTRDEKTITKNKPCKMLKPHSNPLLSETATRTTCTVPSSKRELESKLLGTLNWKCFLFKCSKVEIQQSQVFWWPQQLELIKQQLKVDVRYFDWLSSCDIFNSRTRSKFSAFEFLLARVVTSTPQVSADGEINGQVWQVIAENVPSFGGIVHINIFRISRTANTFLKKKEFQTIYIQLQNSLIENALLILIKLSTKFDTKQQRIVLFRILLKNLSKLRDIDATKSEVLDFKDD